VIPRRLFGVTPCGESGARGNVSGQRLPTASIRHTGDMPQVDRKAHRAADEMAGDDVVRQRIRVRAVIVVAINIQRDCRHVHILEEIGKRRGMHRHQWRRTHHRQLHWITMRFPPICIPNSVLCVQRQNLATGSLEAFPDAEYNAGIVDLHFKFHLWSERHVG
jgi:hypothetical protein